jgi:hypothetical protein
MVWVMKYGAGRENASPVMGSFCILYACNAQKCFRELPPLTSVVEHGQFPMLKEKRKKSDITRSVFFSEES